MVRFVEKPSAAKATEYLSAGNFVWNSGMFCFTADAILAALEVHCQLCSGHHHAGRTLTFERFPHGTVELGAGERRGAIV